MKDKRLRGMLSNLSCQLAIPKEVRKTGNQHMQKIFLTLQKYSNYKLSRCRLLGGVGKKTSISLKFDYDCVIYVNNVDPPFKELLGEWNGILNHHLRNISGIIKVTNYSVQFEVDGFKFDILPASNYTGSINKTESQANIIYKKISQEKMDSKKKDIAYLYSSGLSELALKFMKKQSGFIHDLCRLAKFWNCTIVFDQYVSGRSSIIEYLAVKAGQDEEESTINRKRSILSAFRRFLSYLADYNQINIIFTDVYDESLIMKCEKPYLIDPTNPYNNFLDRVPHDFLPTLAKCSNETLNRLYKCGNNGLIEYEKLFDPQPNLRNSFKDNSDITSINTMISTIEINEKIIETIQKFINRSFYGEENQSK
ncbi:unnamed protein product [Adineta steineri]|uniref:2'-5'-oligoadenylate synthetase 1 domain-containing protein n=1 Tax=Adineta steineri TaxID=433720 RepID=A0A819CFV7_9BILA|nr:unnamed protein product [Adineta steineri]CAF3818555.1 unnamed protein product [Adineta steineri]